MFFYMYTYIYIFIHTCFAYIYTYIYVCKTCVYIYIQMHVCPYDVPNKLGKLSLATIKPYIHMLLIVSSMRNKNIV